MPEFVIYHIDGLHGVHRREGAVSFWIRRPAGLPERDEMLWLAGPGDGNALMPPNQAILHTALTASGHVVFAIENEDADVSLSSSRTISEDKQRWTSVWKATSDEAVWDVPVTQFTAGSHVPGVTARYVKLQLHPAEAASLFLKQVEVFGDESKP